MHIKINGAYGEITELTKAEEGQLWQMFSVKSNVRIPKLQNKRPTRRFYHWGSKRLPVGLVPMVEMMWQGSLQVEDIPKVDALLQSRFGTAELREYQADAIRRMMDRRRGFIEIGTSGGKTYVMGGAICVFPLPCAVIVHDETILKQLVSAFTEWGLDVGLLASGKGEDIAHDVTVCMVKTLHRRLETNDDVYQWWTRFVPTLMIDEGHHCKAKTYQEVLSLSPAAYRFGFTATLPPVTDCDFWDMIKFIGPPIYKMPLSVLRNEDFVAPVQVRLYKYKHSSTKPLHNQAISDAALEDIKCETCRGTGCRGYYDRNDMVYVIDQPPSKCLACHGDGVHPRGAINFSNAEHRSAVARIYYRKVVDQQIVRNDDRTNILAQEANEGTGVLVIVDRIEHGRRLQSCIQNAEFIEGTSKNRQEVLGRLKSGELRCLIATNIVDEGLDIHGIEKIVLSGDIKSERKIIQRIGRGVRKAEGKARLVVVDIDDKGQKYLEKHSKARQKIYTREGFAVEEI